MKANGAPKGRTTVSKKKNKAKGRDRDKAGKTGAPIDSLSESAAKGLTRIAEIANFSLPLQPDIAQRFPLSEEDMNQYQSASVLMQTLSSEALLWQEQLPDNYRPAIIAMLYGGVQVNVHSLAQVSFHGIRIECDLDGAPCSLLAHQSTVQLLCFGEPVDEDAPKRPIGFIWPGNNVEV